MCYRYGGNTDFVDFLRCTKHLEAICGHFYFILFQLVPVHFVT